MAEPDKETASQDGAVKDAAAGRAPGRRTLQARRRRQGTSGAGARDLAGKLLYAGVGAVALTKERTEELAEELARRGKMSRDEARADDRRHGRPLARRGARRSTERAGSSMSSIFRELGLVTRREYEEVELRLAQLEHRLRLLEKKPGSRSQVALSATGSRLTLIRIHRAGAAGCAGRPA